MRSYSFISEDAKKIAEENVRRRQQGIKERHDFEFLKKDGTTIYTTLEAAPITDDEGSYCGAIAGVQDISDRKLAEDALRESEERYRTVADFNYDWEYWIAPDGSLTYISPSCKRITGYKVEEFQQDPELLVRITHPDDRDQLLCHIHDDGNVTTDQENHELDFRIITRSGEERWIGHVCQRVYGSDGKYRGRRASNRDITERKRTGDALQESEEKYRLHFENITDVIYSLDSEFCITSVSPSVEESLGYKPEELIGKKFTDLNILTPESIEKGINDILRVFSGETITEMEYEFIAKDGSHRIAATSGAPLYEENNIIGIVSVGRDITERKKMEETLRESEERFKQIAEVSPLPIAIIDADGSYLFLNRKFIEVFGYTLDDILTGRDWFRLAYPDPEYRKNVISVWKNDRVKSLKGELRLRTFKVRCKHGETKDVIFRPVTMDDCKDLVVYEDITERMQVEKLMAIRHDLGIKVASTTNMKEALELILKTVLQIEEIDSGGIYLMDSATGDLNLMVHEGLSPQFVETVSHFSADSPSAKLVMVKKGEPVYINYKELIPDPDEIRKQEGIRFIAVIPIKHRNNVIAVLNLASHLHDDISRHSRNAIEAIASRVGGIIARNRIEELLKRSEEYFRAIIENSSDIISIINCNGTITFESPSIEKIAGYKPDELIGRNAFSYIHPEDHSMAVQAFENVLRKQGDEDSIEFRFLHKNGSYIFLECKAINLIDNPVVSGIVVSASDISERKRAEEKHKLAAKILEIINTQIEEKAIISEILVRIKQFGGYEAVAIRLGEAGDYPYFEMNGFPHQFIEAERYICAKDCDDKILRDAEGNPVLDCMCGNVISGRTNPSLPFFTAKGSFWTNNTTKLLASTKEEDRRCRLRNRCKAAGYESVALIPLRSGEETIGLLQINDHRPDMFTKDQIEYFEGIGASIGIALSRIKWERALRHASNEWRSTFDTMPDIVMLLDKDHRILRTNEAATKAFGLSYDELLGKHCYQVVHGEDKLPDFCIFNKAIANGKCRTFEHYENKSGKSYFVTLSQIVVAPGMPAGWVHIMRDITEYKEMQKELQNKQRFATIGEVAGGIAHEIKNPLFAISSGVQILQDELKLEEDQKQTLDTIFKETMRADRLIKQLLVYSGKQEIRRSSQKLQALIGEVVSLYQGLSKSKGVAVVINMSPDAQPLFIDRDKISQVLINLLQNAIEASKTGDTIEIWLDSNHNRNRVIIKMSDMGPGIKEGEREKVFNLFYTTKKGSTGMGLAISKKIVEDHNGEIWVEERKGGGAVFVIELPILLKNEQHNTNS